MINPLIEHLGNKHVHNVMARRDVLGDCLHIRILDEFEDGHLVLDKSGLRQLPNELQLTSRSLREEVRGAHLHHIGVLVEIHVLPVDFFDELVTVRDNLVFIPSVNNLPGNLYLMLCHIHEHLLVTSLNRLKSSSLDV